MFFVFLKEYIPVKQGLRLSTFLPNKLSMMSQRVYSSKTRIKTHSTTVSYRTPYASQRVYSSKTRIKTFFIFS